MNDQLTSDEDVVYPESDGRPMGENTLQVKWIVALFNGFEALFRDRPDVFVAADLFWYPVKGDPTTVQAPDVMVVFGRPKGDRGSYRQWVEGGVAPQVVFEVLSPSNDYKSMQKKFRFYERFGAEEYYIYDPDGHSLDVWVRDGNVLRSAGHPDGFASPRLGVTFRVPGGEPMKVVRPDGGQFRSYLELIADNAAVQEKAARLAAKLRELGVDPDAL